MQDGMRDETEARGGCQCGAVRYTVSAGPAKSTVCHCRMCQRATGNAITPLYEIARDRVTWQGTPAVWASSNLAERGFCATCGTPLFYRNIEGDSVELMAGTLTPDFPYAPIDNTGTEARRDWVNHLGDLPDRTTPTLSIRSNQVPEV